MTILRHASLHLLFLYWGTLLSISRSNHPSAAARQLVLPRAGKFVKISNFLWFILTSSAVAWTGKYGLIRLSVLVWFYHTAFCWLSHNMHLLRWILQSWFQSAKYFFIPIIWTPTWKCLKHLISSLIHSVDMSRVQGKTANTRHIKINTYYTDAKVGLRSDKSLN